MDIVRNYLFLQKRNIMKKVVSLVFYLIITAGANAQSKSESSAISKSDYQLLYEFMSGAFSSEAQSQNDTDYYDIRLHMDQIWTNRTDGYWLYVEQAMSTNLEKPYRQRFYRLTQKNDHTIESIVYTIQDPLRFAGAWNNKDLLKSINPDSLELRAGCSILIHKKSDGIFEGSTSNKDCPSNLRGASYATSEVIINQTQMVSWDRGYDGADKQVWGAEKGGYVFVKMK